MGDSADLRRLAIGTSEAKLKGQPNIVPDQPSRFVDGQSDGTDRVGQRYAVGRSEDGNGDGAEVKKGEALKAALIPEDAAKPYLHREAAIEEVADNGAGTACSDCG